MCEETGTLVQRKINTLGDIAVLVKDGSGDMLRNERWCTRRLQGVYGFAISTAMLGPKMRIARCASVGVTKQFQMEFLLIRSTNSASAGRPIF
jgi:hypothetical protein